MGGGGFFFSFLIPLFFDRMLPPPHPDSVGCVCISVPASVENTIVKGNQPSVNVLVWGRKLNVAVFVCYGMLVLIYLFYPFWGQRQHQMEAKCVRQCFGGREEGGQGSPSPG